LLAALSVLIVLAAAAAAGVIALHHPVAPAWATAAACLAMAALARHRSAWLFMVPACAPWLDFSPWTGWIHPSEFDLLLLAALAAGHTRLALDGTPVRWPAPRVCAFVGALLLLGVARAVRDAPAAELGWFDDHFSALNSLRVTKPLAFVLLCAPLLQRELDRDAARAVRRLFAGILAGLAVASVAAAWERYSYPGLLDMSPPYRITALFWEMHVGGAAIDAYLALAIPIVVWGLRTARGWAWWACGAALAMVVTYAAVTTFARGLYLGAEVSLLLLATLLIRRSAPVDAHPWRRGVLYGVAWALAAALLVLAFLQGRVAGVAMALLAAGAIAALWLWGHPGRGRWRTFAGAILTLVLVGESLPAFGPDSFMWGRLLRSETDYGSRAAHWLRGIGLLASPVDWLIGLGAGRLPDHYAAATLEGAPGGRVSWLRGPEGGYVRIAGPSRRPLHPGDLAIGQRVPVDRAYRLALDVATTRGAWLHARVCETHLLYDRACQAAMIAVPPTRPGQTRRVDRRLLGPSLERPAMLLISVVNVGGVADIDNVRLAGADGRTLSENGTFDDGRAHWLPVARRHFLPWHIDNLYLEWLIERGMAGLIAVGGLVAAATYRVLGGAAAKHEAAPYLAASIVAVLTVGTLSSVMDAPRVVVLAGLLVLMALRLAVRPCPEVPSENLTARLERPRGWGLTR